MGCWKPGDSNAKAGQISKVSVCVALFIAARSRGRRPNFLPGIYRDPEVRCAFVH